MSDERTIPVCDCVEPDPVQDFPVPLCCGCGRLVVPEKYAAMKRVEVRARPEQGRANRSERAGDGHE